MSTNALRENVRASYAEAALAVGKDRCECATGCCEDGGRADCCDESCCASEASFAGALSKGEYEDGLRTAGLTDVSVLFTREVADGMHAAIVKAVKPGR